MSKLRAYVFCGLGAGIALAPSSSAQQGPASSPATPPPVITAPGAAVEQTEHGTTPPAQSGSPDVDRW